MAVQGFAVVGVSFDMFVTLSGVRGRRATARGGSVNDGDSSHNDTILEQVQRQNATMRGLIDAVGRLIAASRALVARLAGDTEGGPPPDTKP